VNGPRLNWGLLATFEPRPARRAPLDLSREWQVAGESLNLVARAVERLELVGRLSGDPGRVHSNQAKANFPAIFALAVAAATAAEPLRSHSRANASNALRAWARVYRPTGNPIDEWFFVPLLQAIDLIGDDEPLRGWAGGFAASGDRFYEGRADRNPCRGNNWMARRLLIRTVAATVTGDDAARAQLPRLLEEFVARNYLTGHPAGCTPTSSSGTRCTTTSRRCSR
jgi:hypothetical protein